MKKLLCAVLTVTLAIGMAFSASAAVIITGPGATGGGPGPVVGTTSSPVPVVQGTGGVVTTGIKGINVSSNIGDLADFAVTLNDDKRNVLSLDDLSSLEVAPGDIIKIPLPGVLFLDSSGYPFSSQPNVSVSALRSASITARASFSRGQGAYTASIGGNKNGSYILIEFDPNVYLTPQRFTSSIYLSQHGSRKATTKITVNGTLQTPEQEVSWGDDYADLSDGSFIHAKTAVRDIELYLGNYCSITRSLAKGGQYAGVAVTDDINEQDLLVLRKHPSIQYIYKLKTINLKTSGNVVRFDLSRRYYVYDANGLYIGMSNQALPYWTKYYLSDKKYDTLKVK